MKEYISTLDIAIWIFLIVAQLVLCGCALKKRLFYRLPCFTVYSFAASAESLLLFAIAFWGSYSTYYHTFYVTGRMVSLLAFLTLIEFGRQVLPGLNLPRKEKALASLVTALAAIALFVWLWPLRSVAHEKRVEVAACLAIAVTFIFIATYSRYLRLRWSRLLGGIACTLGMTYLVDGITKAIMGHYPSAVVLQIRQFREITNVLAVIIWIIVVISPWGEYELTEDALEKIRLVVSREHSNLRDLAAGGSR